MSEFINPLDTYPILKLMLGGSVGRLFNPLIICICKCHICNFNFSSPGQIGRYFADGLFQCISINGEFSILIQYSLNFVPKGAVENKSAFVQVMANKR